MLNQSARFDQTQPTQSLIDFNSARKNRLLSSTNWNQGLNQVRLPQLSRSSSSSKSTKLKLTTIEATLSAIQQDIHNLKLETRVAMVSFRNRGDSAIS
jgi:hypothetical protein